MKPNVVSWICQIVAAVILGQTLFFKFTGAEESVYIFTALGMEPWGRIGSGIAELIAAAMLLYPRLAPTGGILAMGLMVGAIGAHLTKLGIEVKGDGGLLFILALVTFAAAGTVTFLRREHIPLVGSYLA